MNILMTFSFAMLNGIVLWTNGLKKNGFLVETYLKNYTATRKIPTASTKVLFVFKVISNIDEGVCLSLKSNHFAWGGDF